MKTLSRRESPLNDPNPQDADAVSDALGVRPGWFLQQPRMDKPNTCSKEGPFPARGIQLTLLDASESYTLELEVLNITIRHVCLLIS